MLSVPGETGKHNRSRLIWVPGHMGIDENEMADQLARQFSALSLIGPEPALGITWYKG